MPRVPPYSSMTMAMQGSLVLVDAPVPLGFFQQHHQLFLGHLGIFLGIQQLGDQLFPLGEDEVDGSQHMDQQVDQGGAEHGKPLGEVLGNALGGDLAEDQHHHGDHHRGKGGANVPVQLHKQQGGDGGHGTVFSPIVKGLRPFFSRMRRPCSFFFPLFKAHPWAIPAQPSKTATRSSRITRSALPS